MASVKGGGGSETNELIYAVSLHAMFSTVRSHDSMYVVRFNA